MSLFLCETNSTLLLIEKESRKLMRIVLAIQKDFTGEQTGMLRNDGSPLFINFNSCS